MELSPRCATVTGLHGSTVFVGRQIEESVWSGSSRVIGEQLLEAIETKHL